MRERGNPDIAAYAVYDFELLRTAVEEALLEKDSTRHLRLIARKVRYDHKDIDLLIEKGFVLDDHFYPILNWVESVFVKSPNYLHEEEVRLLVVDPNNLGNLDDNITELTIGSDRIAGSIVFHGLL